MASSLSSLLDRLYLKKLIKLNVNTDTIIKIIKLAGLSKNIATAILYKQT